MEPRRIVVIDDESDTRVALFDLLKSEGYFVATFENPHEALTKIQEIKPDLVFLDVRMPQVNGIDFLPDLKLAAPQAHVVILTAYANFEIFRQAQERGAVEMMIKPFSTRGLVERTRELVGAPQAAAQ